MTPALKEEERHAPEREDLILLLKKYARLGYETVHLRGDEGFEAMWVQAFEADREEEKPRD